MVVLVVEKPAERNLAYLGYELESIPMRLNDLLRLNLSFGYRICTGGI